MVDIGYAPYLLRLKDFQLEFLWNSRPHIAAWFDKIGEQPGCKATFADWPNESYASPMREKGVAVHQNRIDFISYSGLPVICF